ncbi:MAG: bifunctional DNA primase/polymerase [Holosporales bacterium]
MGVRIQNIAVSQHAPPALPFASAAAAYADLGWSVIPVARQSKKPLVKWKSFQQTPPNTALLEEWRQHYATANIAVVTGRVSNLLVIDIDDEQAVPALEQAVGIVDILALPVPTVKTGRGWHLYFQYPDAHTIRNATGIVPHVDVRGESGYVILPPSVHNSGHLYQWQAGKSIWDIPPPPLDAPWLRLLVPVPSTFKKKGSIEAILHDLRQAQNGHRNDALNKVAFALGRYVSKGKVSAREAEDMLRQQAQQLGLPDAEATATLHSGLTAGMQQGGASHYADTAKAESNSLQLVDIGSDVEIARHVRADLEQVRGDLIHAEEQFWQYATTHWEMIPEHTLRLAVHRYDGAPYKTPKGEATCVKLSKTRIDSILHEMAALTASPDFFERCAVGINCRSGFIRFDAGGVPSLEKHTPNHRSRHTLPGCWQASAAHISAETLLGRFLGGIFKDDADSREKIQLLAEVYGCAALGYATKLLQPRAVVLKGECAENGKSQVLDLARGILPATAVCTITPARLGDERHIVALAGKLLNASDELSSATAVAAEVFKAVITGEPVEGRDVYKSRVEFRPIAQHLFATNTLPPFQGGMDRGVQRRLLVITFNRVIPLDERIEGIGRRIADEETDLLLTWVVEGASRLIRQRNFTVPTSSKQALVDWMLGADPVLAWLEECVEVQPIINGYPALSTRAVYDHFYTWATAEGFRNEKLPTINGFVQRVQANAAGVEYKRTRNGRLFLGLALRRAATAYTPPYESKDW